MKHLELQNLTPLQRMRIAALAGLVMFLFVMAVRYVGTHDGHPGHVFWTRVLCAAVLTWFAWASEKGSWVERHLFTCGTVLSASLLLHLMLVNYYHTSNTYFFVGLIIMAVLASVAVTTLWISTILLSWTAGLSVTIFVSPGLREDWLGYVVMMYPLAGVI